MSSRLIRKLHRWLGLAFSLSVLLASGSGVIHNVMTRTQAPPPSARPSGGGMDVNAIKLTVAEAVAKLSEPNPEVQAVNLRGIGGQPWYQIYTKASRGPQYVSAVDGKADPAQDEAYAAEIAKNFLAGAEVKKTDFLTAFNTEYLNIFRILPVHRFDTGDALETRVYVSTTTGSVTRHTDKPASVRGHDLHDVSQARLHPEQGPARPRAHRAHLRHLPRRLPRHRTCSSPRRPKQR
jgi:hypothetical protein